MDSAFEDLDAAGFLEIWQHFDADGKDIHSCLLIVLIIKIHKTGVPRIIFLSLLDI